MMEGRLNILFVSMHCRPEPCDTRTSLLAKAMASRGHRATILTSFPNYPYGKTYAGYRQRLVQREQVEGVEIVRVPMIPDHSRSKLRRALSYLSFGFSAALIGALFTKKPDLVWIHHPPLTTGFAGWFLARMKRAPFVYEIHDLWPESLTSTGMVRDGRLTGLIRRACDFLHRRADAVVVTSEGMKRHLVGQGMDAERVHVFPQWADEALFKPQVPSPTFRSLHAMSESFNVVYGGNIGAAQELDVVLEAAVRLQEHRELQFLLVGAGLDLARLRGRVESEDIRNVRLLGQYPPEAMPAFFAQADALLLQLKDDPLFSITIPSKLQTYLAMGRPVLCGVKGEAAQVVEQSGAGLIYEPGNAESLAEAVLAMARLAPEERVTMGQRARETYLAQFAQAPLANRYADLFHKVALGCIAPVSAVVEVEPERVSV